MDWNSLPKLSPPDATWRVAETSIPPSGRLVLYRTAYYQMAGYMDGFGRWVGFDGQEESLPVHWWREANEV